MREKLHTLDRLSPRIQAPDSTTMRRKRMTSRIGLYRKKQFTLPSIVLRRDQWIRELRHQIQDQVLTLISTTQLIVHWSYRLPLGTKKIGVSKKSKAFVWAHSVATLIDSRSHGSMPRKAQILANTLENLSKLTSRPKASSTSLSRVSPQIPPEHSQPLRRRDPKQTASSCRPLIASIIWKNLTLTLEFLIQKKLSVYKMTQKFKIHWWKAIRISLKLVTNVSMTSRTREHSGQPRVVQVTMRCSPARTSASIKHHQDLTITRCSMDKVWSLMFQAQDSMLQSHHNK